MADDFQSGVCSGGSWWTPARSASFDIPPCSAAATDHAGGGSFVAWTMATTDLTETTKKARSCDDQSAGSASGRPLSFQEKGQTPSDVSHTLAGTTLQLPPTFGLSSISADWPQDSLTISGRTESRFHAMLQEDLGSRSYVQDDQTIETINRVHIGTETSSTNQFKDMSHNLSLDRQCHLSSGNNGGVGDIGISSVPLLPAWYECSPTSTVLQALLLEPEGKDAHQSIYDNLGPNCHHLHMMTNRGNFSELLQQPPSDKFSQLLKSSPLKQQPGNQLLFSNNTPFWNASALISSTGEARSGFCSPTTPPQFAIQGAFVPQSTGSILIAKTNKEATFRPDSCSSSSTKNSGEPAFKKPRMEAPSPSPTFKVRKEKLGDRITALQQLVSPFGKTDTASVLHEAIEYIKFLHDQVAVLSTPYLKGGHPMPSQQGLKNSKDSEGLKKDLRSRGLCLVPIASTYPLANETTVDFWHPTLGGTFR